MKFILTQVSSRVLFHISLFSFLFNFPFSDTNKWRREWTLILIQRTKSRIRLPIWIGRTSLNRKQFSQFIGSDKRYALPYQSDHRLKQQFISQPILGANSQRKLNLWLPRVSCLIASSFSHRISLFHVFFLIKHNKPLMGCQKVRKGRERDLRYMQKPCGWQLSF